MLRVKQLKALIVPHSGYNYSGYTAASAYKPIFLIKNRVSRVVLIGPSHRMYIHNAALSSNQVFNTPPGNIRLDTEAQSNSGDTNGDKDRLVGYAPYAIF